MRTEVSSRGFLSLVAIVVAGAIFLPARAWAIQIPMSDLAVIETGLEQSAFQNLTSCVLANPTAPISSEEIIIDVPDGKTAYRGADQPSFYSVGPYKSVWFCDKQEVAATLVKGDKWYNPYANVRGLTTAETTAVWAIGNLISLLATIAIWIIWLASQLLAPLLGVGSFITNPLVRSGWPFVQGIANLGFLLALLFIAFATTLRLDSFSVRKTLPRLLLAALLINFSLIITGVLIDVSRLVMAALLAILGNNALDDLAFNLLRSSNVVAINFDLQTFQSHGYAAFQGKTTSWQTVASALQAAILLWGLAAGFIILIVGLLMRYIMLILLLIVSPLAFLAVALPNTAQLANKWWSTFIMYVLYGPVAVFILILTVAASQGLASDNNTFINNVLNLFVVIAMMIAAAVAGKKLGIMGAGAAVSFVSTQGKRAGRTSLWAGRAVAGAAGGRQISYAAGDVGRYVGDRFKKALPKSIRPVERDEKTGKVKAGQKSGVTQVLEKSFGKALTPDQTKEAQAARSTIQNIKTAGNDPTRWDTATRDTLNPVNLRREHVTEALGNDTIVNNVVAATDDPQNINALLNNKGFLRGLGRQDQVKFIANIQANTQPKMTADLKGKMVASAIKAITQANEDK